MRLRFSSSSGRAVLKYDRECFYQPQFMYIFSDGEVYFKVQESIGDAMPESVFHGLAHRIHLVGLDDCITQSIRRRIYRDCKPLLKRVVDGMGEDYDWSGNRVGTLTDDARDALERLCLKDWTEYRDC